MNRLKTAAFIATAIVLLSCNFVIGAATQIAPTADSVSATPGKIVEGQQAVATEPQPDVEAATETIAPVEPTTLPSDTPPPPTATFTLEPTPSEYIESFDGPLSGWSEPLVVTTQAIGGQYKSTLGIDNKGLLFAMADKETYMYSFIERPFSKDVEIEAVYQSLVSLQNGIAIVCRANAEHTSWYEVRISSESKYAIYLYDKRRKDVENKNPYAVLAQGGTKIRVINPTEVNTFKVTCEDSQISVDINAGRQIITQSISNPIDGDQVGLGAMSYGQPQVKINFNEVTVRPLNP